MLFFYTLVGIDFAQKKKWKEEEEKISIRLIKKIMLHANFFSKTNNCTPYTIFLDHQVAAK